MKRRFATLYYKSGVYRGRPQHIARGTAASIKGAVRATVVRVFMGEYKGCYAVVYDRELEMNILVVRIGANGLEVKATAELTQAQATKLRRVK